MNKVILTIFAGRESSLKVLFKYLDIALERNIIHEIHLWNYTRKRSDERYLYTINKEHYHILNVTNKKNWSEYYNYYTNIKFTNDIILKCDDDIVFIDVNKLPSYIQAIQDTDLDILFPNIINNGVAAYYQQHIFNLIPREELVFEYPLNGLEGTLWESAEKASKLHEYFIDNIDTFLSYSNDKIPIVELYSRFSINMFIIKGNNWHKIQQGSGDDEHYITVICRKEKHLRIGLFTSFFISHLSFYKQIRNGFNQTLILQRYHDLYHKLYKND